MKKLIVLLISGFILFSCARPGIDNPEITRKELKDHISYLSSDSLKGRKPGTPEGRLAAEYIANQYLSFGYKPLGDNIYQYFDVITQIEAGDKNRLIIDDYTAKLDTDFVPVTFSSNTAANGEIVYCGFGFDISGDSIQWNDYEKINLKNKWALILHGDPEMDNPDSKFIPYSNEKSKILSAKDHGAIGVIFVSGTSFDKKDELNKLVLNQAMANFGIPAFQISRNLADKLLSDNQTSIDEQEQILIKNKKPNSFYINKKADAEAEIIYTKVHTQNVVVWMEGTDPELKKEYVLIGGHYDHLGFGGPNSGSRAEKEHAIHHGADDNASGVASVIEIAEKLAFNKKDLKRSVIIMAFGAEEIGLLGSKFFTENPLVKLSDIKAMINIDMVGRLKKNKELLIGGSGTAKESEALLDSLSKGFDLVMSFSPNGFGPSDHASFYIENIPVFFFSTGAHADYHTPRDVVEKINFEGLKTLDDYIYSLCINLINRDTDLQFQEAGPKGKIKTGRKSKVKLGIMPNFGKSDNNGMRVDAVTPQGPAFVAGMKKDDVIIAIAGKSVHNIYEYMDRMSRLKFGQTITVDVMRDSTKIVLLVQLEEIQ
ncbi:MAG: M20/M25/M40 family metallo-hydrolase [Chlorobi bacterium]|nr:M20/M25/M40 family metallo-hydrolase [Chlorobiota bacterium]